LLAQYFPHPIQMFSDSRSIQKVRSHFEKPLSHFVSGSLVGLSSASYNRH